MNRTVSRTLRTLAQLVAAGGLTGVVAAIASGLSAWAATVLLAASTLAVVVAQNLLESAGKVPTILEDAHAREAPPTP